MEKISGHFEHIIYRQEENFFTVARFKLHDASEKTILVTGHIENLDKEILYHLEGEYVEHPRYGMQFKVYYLTKAKPTDRDALIRYFSSSIFPGIGEKMAEIVVDALGEEVIEKIRDNPACLDGIDKMNDKKKKALIDGVSSEEDAFSEMTKFFMQHGLGIRNILKLNHAYGKDAISKMSENPYRAVEEVDGFGFKTTDKIALSMGFELDHPFRLKALLASVLMEMCMSTGDSYMNQEDLVAEFRGRIYPIVVDDVDFFLSELEFSRQIKLEDNRVFPISQYDSESGIAQYLATFPQEHLDPYQDDKLKKALSQIQEKLNIEYDQKQIEAIHCFFEKNFMILTGGPGTGKTTVVRGMISIFKELYPQALIACCAPTGRAAKRLSELTDVPAYTIHSLLKWDLETNTFGKNQNEPLFLDLLVIDEFSMVDNWLFYNLVCAGAHIKKICIIGDEDQLPSVGPGSVLKDLIDSKCFPLIRLSHIFRQQSGSDVVKLSSQIRDGYFDFSSLTNDVAFFSCTQYDVKRHVISIVEQALSRGFELKDIQVLACMYQGAAGIDRLNNALQECFNPADKEKREWKVGYKTYREQDKILQLKNMPDDDVYNGDIGTLVDIIYVSESESKQVTFLINFDGIFVEYGPDDFDKISHAYCISVHKSQGSEYPIVVMPVVHSYARMLQRRLIYTGITRAKKSLVLLGETEALQKGIDQIEIHYRKTTLCKRITEEFVLDD